MRSVPSPPLRSSRSAVVQCCALYALPTWTARRDRAGPAEDAAGATGSPTHVVGGGPAGGIPNRRPAVDAAELVVVSPGRGLANSCGWSARRVMDGGQWEMSRGRA